MKTRNLYILLMLFVLSCSKSEKQSGKTASFPQTTIANAQQDTITNVLTDSFNDKGESWYQVIKDTTRIKNVTFSPYLQFIIKQTQEIKLISNYEGQESKIDIDIFDLTTDKKIRSFSVDADDIHFSTLNYYLTTKYGCCAEPNELEMGEIWKDNVFLRADNEIYVINQHIYFGFTNVWNSKEGILGELNFARGYNGYTNFKSDKKLIFKVRDKELVEEYCDLCTTITLVAPTPDWTPHFVCLSRLKSVWLPGRLEEINHNIIKIDFVFGGDTERTASVDIPLQNGLIFGNRNFEQIIYVDDFLKKSGN